MAPKISVVIPTYNRSEKVQRAIQSVISQTYKFWELVIVDDGSTDDTLISLDSLNTHDDHIQIHSRPHGGAAASRNFGIGKATGEWIGFLDSDDWWHPEKLQQQVLDIQNNPFTKIFHTEECWIRNGKPAFPQKKHRKQSGEIFEQAVQLCPISMSTVLVHRSLFNELGYFDSSYPVCEDYDFWLRSLWKYPVYLNSSLLVTQFAETSDQLSKKFVALDYYRVKSLVKIIKNEHISEQKKVVAVASATRRCELLLRGYKKHSNMKHYDEIERIYKELICVSLGKFN